MFLVSSCSCLYPIHWSPVSSREWRCSWRSADRRCSNYNWVINTFIASKGRLILEIWRYVGNVGHHWFRQWLVTCSAPSHDLNHGWLIINWSLGNIRHGNLNQNTTVFIQNNWLANAVCEKVVICLGLNELILESQGTCLQWWRNFNHLNVGKWQRTQISIYVSLHIQQT